MTGRINPDMLALGRWVLSTYDRETGQVRGKNGELRPMTHREYIAAKAARESMLSIEIPYPPSANKMWRKGQGKTYLSAEYRQFIENVGAALLANGRPTLGQARLVVRIHVYPPDAKLRDLDNVIKPTLDALAKGGLFSNDAQVDRIELIRQEITPHGKLLVTAAPI